MTLPLSTAATARSTPADATEPWTAPAGLLCLRPVRPEDKAAMATFLADLSPRSRQRRFLAAKHRFTERELRGLTVVDQDRHVAWVAVDLADGGERIVAEARFVRLAGRPGSAEVGVAVADSLQGRGLGRMLMATLAREARRGGVTELHGYVDSGNRPMLRRLEELGARMAVDHPGVMRARVPLGGSPCSV